jgi:hypothetical protein
VRTRQGTFFFILSELKGGRRLGRKKEGRERKRHGETEGREKERGQILECYW